MFGTGKLSSATSRLIFTSREQIRRAFSRVNERPIFVLGNQKSGTSAIVSLLGEATARSFTNDVFCWCGDAETRVLRGELGWNEFVESARFYFSRDLVKDPGFTFLLEHMENRFPEARYVFVVRNPFTNIRSILNRLDLPGNIENLTSDQLRKVALERPLWMPVLTGLSGDCQGENYIEILAHRSAKALDLCASERLPWVTVRYEDFLADKTGCIESLSKTLGLDVIKDITPIIDRPFQPPSTDKTDTDIYFGEKNFARIRTICSTAMAKFDYSADE